jgi:hypothetical protein
VAEAGRSVALGLKLGEEVLRGPNGVWYSAVRPNGKPAGVLRFDADRVSEAGVLDRLVERVVAARSGAFPGVLPIVDLVEDSGRIWLVTSVPPVPDAASRTEEALLGAGSDPGPMPEGASTDSANPSSPGRRRRRWIAPALTTLVVSAIIVGIGVATGLFVQLQKKDPPGPPLSVSGVTVHQVGLVVQNGAPLAKPLAVTTTNICNGSVDMVATLETNNGKGSFAYEWDLTNSAPVTGTATFTTSERAPQDLHLSWGLRLHGSGVLTATFKILTPTVSGLPPQAATLSYACP